MFLSIFFIIFNKKKIMNDKQINEIKTQIGIKLLEDKKQQKNRKTFFASDPHFQDKRLNLYGRDLMFKNSNEVDDYIVKKWNEVVSDNDLVILTGDISMTRDGLDTLNLLNGEKWLVKGNYDVSVEEGGTAKYEINDKILGKYFTKVVDELEMEIGGEKVYINHYPVNAKSDMFNICGHIHGIWKVQRNIINVGLDAWHFTPIDEDMIEFQMNGIRKHYDQNVYAGELDANMKNRVGKIRIIRAPEENLVTPLEDDVFVFFAGPIQGTDTEKLWQEDFISSIEKEFENVKMNKNVFLCSPRRLGKFTKENFDYDVQVNWEDKHLDLALNQGVVVFWLANEYEKLKGRSFAQTTRFELGEYFAKCQNVDNAKIIIGAESKFDGTRYIEKKFSDSFDDFKLIKITSDMKNEIIKQIKLKIK